LRFEDFAVKHAIIIGHPKERSFIATMAKAYTSEVRGRGNAVEVRNLYAMNFDPRLMASELPGENAAPMADVARERELLKGADVFAFFYPFWFNAPPAMLKGYMERVFGFGFAYERAPGGTNPLLAGSKLFSVSSTGAPREWVQETGAWDAECQLFDKHFAAVCGLTVVDHLHFGNIIPGIRPDVIERSADVVRDAVRKHF
jgi:NAD(P)H dehydrogenase (quinone)